LEEELWKKMPGCLIISSTLDPCLEDEEDRNYNLMIKRAFTAKGFPVYSTLGATIKTLSNLSKFGQGRRQE
jgi:hypothetical protein